MLVARDGDAGYQKNDIGTKHAQTSFSTHSGRGKSAIDVASELLLREKREEEPFEKPHCSGSSTIIEIAVKTKQLILTSRLTHVWHIN